MKWPALVPQRLCKTPCTVTLYREGVSEDGAPLEAVTIETACNWQDSARTVRTSQTQTVTITGTALFPGDIAPELAVISSGTLTIFGVSRSIVAGTKCRNPDNTVNYTRLDVS